MRPKARITLLSSLCLPDGALGGVGTRDSALTPERRLSRAERRADYNFTECFVDRQGTPGAETRARRTHWLTLLPSLSFDRQAQTPVEGARRRRGHFLRRGVASVSQTEIDFVHGSSRMLAIRCTSVDYNSLFQSKAVYLFD